MKNKKKPLAFVIFASSLGSLVEWYDFFTFASLNTIISSTFFSISNSYFAIVSTAILYSIGYIFRPLGGVLFGYIGDKIGRKNSLLFSMSLMGFSTFLIGCIPAYHTIGILAPILLLFLRICQGISLGGEYSNAAIYVAEHVSYRYWGRSTASIQITPTLGIILSVCIIAILKLVLSSNHFLLWGWRIAFWVSIILILFALKFRLKLTETPLYLKIKEQKTYSAHPLKDSFHITNIPWLLIAFFISIGTGVISNGATIYLLFFVENTMHVNIETSSWLFAIALTINIPLYYLIGWYHDRWGTKWLFIICMIVFSFSLRGTYGKMYNLVNTTNTKIFMLQSSVTTVVKNNTSTHDTLYMTTTTNTYYNKMKEIIEKQYYAKDHNPIQEKKNIFLSYHQKIILLGYFLYFVIITVAVNASLAAFIMSLFPTHIRSSSFGMSYIGATLLGGVIIPIATYFVQKEQQLNTMAMRLHQPIPYPHYFTAGLLYPIIISVLAAIVLLFAPSKKILDKRNNSNRSGTC